MTRFARKGGVTEKKESKKKKEEGTEWSTMFKAPETAVESEIIESECVKKRKHEEILDKKINEEKSENGVAIAPASTKIRDRETLLKTHGKYIDSEVLADLDEMLANKKITETEYADSIIREGRSNRRRLDRKNERDSAIVCFKCRKSGHCIDECPEVKDDCEQGTGICYKCGSTEHSVNKCKARVEAGTYPYATCFICKEQGHISKQCPDNPRGLYPNGGCCRSCGSVEHYYRDCPEIQKKNLLAETKTIKKLRPNDNLEELSDDDIKKKDNSNFNLKKKVVVFK